MPDGLVWVFLVELIIFGHDFFAEANGAMHP